MSVILTYAEIKAALGLPSKCRISTVVNELDRRKLPYSVGKGGVFATVDAWTRTMMGLTCEPGNKDDIEFL